MKYSTAPRFFALIMTAILILPSFRFAASPVLADRQLTDEQKILHVLNRLGYGPRPGDVERIKKIGLKSYINEQLDPLKIDDLLAETKVRSLDVFTLSTSELFAKYPNPGVVRQIAERQSRGDMRLGRTAGQPTRPSGDDDAGQLERRQKIFQIYREHGFRPANTIQQQIVANRSLRAVYSERQLLETMVDFWQNHFNVFIGKNTVRPYIPSYERDVLRKHALGNFRDLVLETAKHPAMLAYLDNFESVAPGSGAANGRVGSALARAATDPRVRERVRDRLGLTDAEFEQRMQQMSEIRGRAQSRGINENYARELLELHTLGVDGGYTQADIVAVAKVFTGWTISDPRGVQMAARTMGAAEELQGRIGRMVGRSVNGSGSFYFNSNWHDKSDKFVLGHKISSDGMNEGVKVIDILVNHPSTAKFIARKLAVKFVSDDPDPAFVDRIAKVFTASKGDIKTTLRAIFDDKEFFDVKNYRAKIKTPFELAVSSIRALGAEMEPSPVLAAMFAKLGETPYGYQAPTGYIDNAEVWVNPGALLERLNFVIALASNRIPNTRVDLARFQDRDSAKVVEKVIRLLLNGEISDGSRKVLLEQIKNGPPKAVEAYDVESDEMGADGIQAVRPRLGQLRLRQPSGDPELYTIVSLVMGTPEFQRQ